MAFASSCSLALSVMVVVFGGLLIGSAFLTPIWMRASVHSNTEKNCIVTSNKSLLYQPWANAGDPEMPPLYVFWTLWNLTNPQEFLLGAKPVMQAVGPYWYDWKKYRILIEWNEDRTERRFKEYMYYLFNRNKTDAALEPATDMITTINVPFLVTLNNLVALAGGQIDTPTWWQQLLFAFATSLNHEELIVTKSVDSMIWGYNNSMLEWAQGIFGNGTVPRTYFGWMQPPNMTSEAATDAFFGYSVEQTGKDGPNTTYRNAWNTIMWNGSSVNRYWATEEANTVWGTIAEHWAPFWDKEYAKSVKIWAFQIYRTVEVYYNHSVKHKGIPCYHMLANDTMWKNCTEYEPNCGLYGGNPAPGGVRLRTGQFNMTPPGFLAPIYLSQPHFTNADPWYLEQVEGMMPNASAYTNYVDVEPITGSSMAGFAAVQVNIRLTPLLLLYPYLPQEVYVPGCWVALYGEINDPFANEWLTTMGTAVTIATYSRHIGLIAGPVIVLLGLVGAAIAVASYFWRTSAAEGRSVNDDGDAERQPLFSDEYAR